MKVAFLHISITTNGTLLTPEIAKKMKQYNFSVCISLDGPREINNYSRKFKDGSGSFDSIVAGIKCLQDEKIDYAIEATITHKQFMDWDTKQFYNYFNFFVNTGVRLVGFFADINDDVLNSTHSQELQTITKFYNSLVDFYFELLLKGDEWVPVFSNVFSIIAKILSNSQNGFCLAGINQVFTTAHGDIYPCQTYYAAKKSRMGDLRHMDEYFEETKKIQQIACHRIPIECKSCTYFKYCESKCPGSNLLANGKEDAIISLRCVISKILVNRVIVNMAQIGQDEKKLKLFEKNFLYAAQISDSLNGKG